MELRPRQAQRTEVGRAHPRGAEQGCADRDLRRSSSHVDHCDDVGKRLGRSRHSAVVREPAFALGCEDSDVERGCVCQRLDQRRRRCALSAGRSDDHRGPVDFKVRCEAGVAGADPGTFRDLRGPERSRALDLGAESKVVALTCDLDDLAVGLDVGDEKANRV